MMKIKNLIIKHKEILLYAFFGLLTTLVNFISYYILETACGNSNYSYLYNNLIAWLISVIFAYVTNKHYVFKSKNWSAKIVTKELAEFFGARVFSFLIEELGLFLLVDCLAMSAIDIEILFVNITGDLIAKLLLAVIVVIMNYFFSKFFIFKKNEK